METRTSITSRIRIDEAAVPGQTGILGLTLCPGKQGNSSWGEYRWERDLQLDARVIADWQPAVWINLMEPEEMSRWGVAALPEVAATIDQYFNLPIVDRQAPDQQFESDWIRVGAIVRDSLRSGKKVLIQCRGGMGRAGTVAARILVEFGMPPEQAIRTIRVARKGAVETTAQSSYLLGLRSATGPVERIRGGLLGLLIGDALGVPYEFKSPKDIPPRDEIEMIPPRACRPSYPSVPPGTWSDDGAQALCLLESLTSVGSLDPDDFGQRLLQWRHRGHMAVDGVVFDIGVQTSRALSRLHAGVPALEAGATSSDSCGNGSLMRVLGLALWHQGSVHELFELAMLQSKVTHGHLQAQLSCALYCGVARQLLDGASALSAWDSAIAELKRYCANDPTRARELQCGILASVYRAQPTGSGYVVDTLWSAYACLQQSNYEACVRAAIALGNDTDTTAAVVGGLAGILYGEYGIPKRWVDTLRGRAIADPLLHGLENRVRQSSVRTGARSSPIESPIALALAKVSLGVLQKYRNLAMRPLMTRSDARPAYELLDLALQKGSARVMETSEGGSIAELSFENLGDTPILLVDGEELRGARQNRILNATILVGARKRVVIPVSCVERGRWAYQRRDFVGGDQMLFASGRRANAQVVTESMRSRGVAAADQQQLWQLIDERFRSSAHQSKTAAMSDFYEGERNRIEEFQQAFSWAPGQVGGLFAVNGIPVAVELFDSPETCRRFIRKIVASFAMDALGGRELGEPAVKGEDFEDFLRKVTTTPLERVRTVGEGQAHRLVGERAGGRAGASVAASSGACGGALEYEGRLLHLGAFSSLGA